MKVISKQKAGGGELAANTEDLKGLFLFLAAPYILCKL